MRSPRLPPLDTSEYVSCPIGTPLFDFDQKSPLPCIIVTPSSPTEYHIAFHHKSSPLKHVSFSQQQQQPRARRAFLTALNPFVPTPPPGVATFELAHPRRIAFKPRTRTALILAVPIFIFICHVLASSLFRGVGFRRTLFGTSIPHGGFSSAAAHMRAQRDAQPLSAPPPQPLPRAAEPDAMDIPALD